MMKMHERFIIPDELRYQLEDSQAKAIITDQSLLSIARSASRQCQVKVHYRTVSKIICVSKVDVAGVDDLTSIFANPAHSQYSPVPIEMEKDLLLLPYSSGTSGLPKGVMLSHRNYVSMLASYIVKFTEDYKALGADTFVAPPYAIAMLPFYHAMGIMLFNFYCGTTQIVMNRFDLKTWLKTIQDYEIPMVSVVPAIAAQLADSPLLDNYDLSSLMVVASGSAPLSKGIVAKITKRVPHVRFREGYGMTELSMASHMSSLDTPDGSVGRVMPGMKMKIINENGQLCGPYERGEIWMSGPQVMLGYWRKPEQTREIFDSDGFMCTGDIGFYDVEGFTFISDRKKELIKVNGKQVSQFSFVEIGIHSKIIHSKIFKKITVFTPKFPSKFQQNVAIDAIKFISQRCTRKRRSSQVSPSEIEALLTSLPGISDCCVFGVPDEKYGELPVAHVVSQSIDEQRIHSFVNERLAPHKRLRGGIKFVDQLPRTSTGKLLRRLVKDEHLKSMRARDRSRL
ncbi:unnamed protein product [Nippostrongylus brasiliensis]|uniref:4-coumarate--CoA ligase n=1 Tax=Nippostrongylus brasiliensis TaxID=27835 RepID=A0A0N4Y1R6_NIPBR|nr:unnamed protein product [Nippostrongylus brasiliensis]